MNSKFCNKTNITIHKNKQRLSHSDVPNKQIEKVNLIQLSHYFNKRHTNPSNILHEQQSVINKQNCSTRANAGDPKKQCLEGLSPSHQVRKHKQVTSKKPSNRKIITLKASNIKNSRERKQYSTEKRINTLNAYYQDTDVAQFDEEIKNNWGNHHVSGQSSSIQKTPQNQFSTRKYNHLIDPTLNSGCRQQERVHPKVVEVDLQKHRKSMQDTLTSSSGVSNNFHAGSYINISPSRSQKHINQNIVNNRNQQVGQENSQNMDVKAKEYCSNPLHHSIFKIATFMVKGQPYCQKCAAGFITNGQLAIRIRSNSTKANNTGNNKIQQNKRLIEYNFRSQSQEDQRLMQLNNFIGNLDKIQPKFQRFEDFLFQTPNLVQRFEQHFCSLETSIDKWLEKSIQTLTQKHSQLRNQVESTSHEITRYLKQLGFKVNEQLQNIRFMRNDIIQNLNSIVKVHIVKSDNFSKVYTNYENQFNSITQIEKQISDLEIVVPEFSFKSTSQQLKNILAELIIDSNPRRSKQLFSFETDLTPQKSESDSSISHRNQCAWEHEEQKVHRLSFGKELSSTSQREIISPTFKAI